MLYTEIAPFIQSYLNSKGHVKVADMCKMALYCATTEQYPITASNLNTAGMITWYNVNL